MPWDELPLVDADIERAIAVAEGNPRRLLRAAGDIQAGMAPVSSAADEFAQRASAVAGPLAGALVGYLAAHGPAAASDETMLRQIGASRQRASQLMHELESAGLLETIEQHEPGAARAPRASLRLADPCMSDEILTRLLGTHAFVGSRCTSICPHSTSRSSPPSIAATTRSKNKTSLAPPSSSSALSAVGEPPWRVRRSPDKRPP